MCVCVGMCVAGGNVGLCVCGIGCLCVWHLSLCGALCGVGVRGSVCGVEVCGSVRECVWEWICLGLCVCV